MTDTSKLEQLRALYAQAEEIRAELGIEVWPEGTLFQALGEDWQIIAYGDGLGGGRVEEINILQGEDEIIEPVREQICPTELACVELAQVWVDEKDAEEADED